MNRARRNCTTARKPPTPFHNLHYTYDKVGNVTHLVNNVSVQPWRPAGVFVGPLDVTYSYDNLHQLRSLLRLFEFVAAFFDRG